MQPCQFKHYIVVELETPYNKRDGKSKYYFKKLRLETLCLTEKLNRAIKYIEP